jgi:hypothetical protein
MSRQPEEHDFLVCRGRIGVQRWRLGVPVGELLVTVA